MIKLKCLGCGRLVETTTEEIKEQRGEKGEAPTCKKCNGGFEEVYNDEKGTICNECERDRLEENLSFFPNLSIKLCNECIEEIYNKAPEGKI